MMSHNYCFLFLLQLKNPKITLKTKDFAHNDTERKKIIHYRIAKSYVFANRICNCLSKYSYIKDTYIKDSKLQLGELKIADH